MKVHVGTSYYAEDWDNDRIRKDALLMQQAGITYARMGEFAWSHMEPREGEFHFQWLKDAVNILGEYGIRTILCTPSSAAPGWMCCKYPEILRFFPHSNHRAWFGVRDHTCYTSRTYRRFVRNMARRMALEFQGNPYIAGWQIDNEPGCSRFPDCSCPDCQRAFRDCMKKKYGTLKNLNQSWGTTFWSGEFSDWEEIELEERWENMGSCRALDSLLFRSDEIISFIQEQANEIRKVSPDTLIGTNTLTFADRFKAFSNLDIVGNDRYPRGDRHYTGHFFDTDLYANLKPETSPWMLEAEPATGWPRRDLMRFYFWSYVAHGYDHIFYFHWAQHLAGNEKTKNFIIGPSGVPSIRYNILKRIIEEANLVLKDEDPLPQPQHECAMILDYSQWWTYALSVSQQYGFYRSYMREHFLAFRKYSNAPAIVSSTVDFSSYKVVDLLIYPHISKEFAEKLIEYVRNGGILLMHGRSGMFDKYSKNLQLDGPEYLQELFGVIIGENHTFGAADEIPIYNETLSVDSEHTVVSGELAGKKLSGIIGIWTAYITVDKDTKILMKFANSALKGYPFLTLKQYGKGFTLYFPADAIDTKLLGNILAYAQSLAGIKEKMIPDAVDMIRRRDLIFLSNFEDTPVSFAFDWKGDNLIGKALQNGQITLSPFGTAVIKIKS